MRNKEKYLVVGGNSGIGRAIVDVLAKDNEMVVCDKNISKEISEKYCCYQIDLRNQNEVLRFAKDIVCRQAITNMIYSAGYQENTDILELDIDSWNSMFQVNVSSAFVLAQAVSKNVLKKRKGALVFISSIHGDIIREIPHYSSSKAAQNMMMKEFAYKLAPFGGRAFSIAPGSIDTPLLHKDLNTEEMFIAGEKNIPLLRHGKAVEIAEAVNKLLQVEYLTGTVVVIDGGLSLVI